MKAIYEKDLENAFLNGLNNIINTNYASKLEKDIDKAIRDNKETSRIELLNNKLKELQDTAFDIAKAFKDNEIDITTYTIKINETMKEIDSITTELNKIKNKSATESLHKHTMEQIRKLIKESLTEFDKDIFRALVDEVIIINQVQARFILKTGMEFIENL